MTIGGIAGMAVTTPAGALVDRTHRKRAIVMAPACANPPDQAASRLAV